VFFGIISLMRAFLLRLSIVARYLIAGGTAAGVNFTLLFIFTEFFGWWYLMSATVAFAVAIAVSFSLQKFYTFRDTSGALSTQGTLFLTVQLVNVGINAAFMFALVEWAGAHYMLAQIIAGGAIALWSFVIYRFFIFRESSSRFSTIHNLVMDSQSYEDIFHEEAHHWWFRGRRAIIQDILQRFVLPHSSFALDVGCGTGYNANLLSSYASHVEGVEWSHEAATLMRSTYPKILLHEKNFLALDPAILPRYDLITLFDVLEHLPYEAQALKLIHQLLQKNGRLVISVPAFPFLWSEHDMRLGHVRRYTIQTLCTALENAGFVLHFISYFNFILFPIVVLIRYGKKICNGVRYQSDFSLTSPLLNRVLAFLFMCEKFLLRWWRLPFGVSIICVASRR